MIVQRLQALVALLAGGILLLMLWIALSPTDEQQVMEALPTAVPAASPTPRPTATLPPAVSLRFAAEHLPVLEVFEADTYQIPVRIYNDGTLSANDVAVILTWGRERDRWYNGYMNLLSIPPMSSITTTFTFVDDFFPGPGTYPFRIHIRFDDVLPERRSPAVIPTHTHGVLRIIPSSEACDAPPNLRLLPETLAFSGTSITVRVRNEGSQPVRNVRVIAEWSDPGGERGSAVYTLRSLYACGGEGLALLRLSDHASSLISGSLITITARLVDEPDSDLQESTLLDNMVTVTAP
ncbi:MAG: hypothetical protein KatS3mg057_1989 [Herpetosiphonaceae bacterium]|nr:MAG: hypothetical protein KatS3mg057_1989 [Herpetosiphonaceae bacterium]